MSAWSMQKVAHEFSSRIISKVALPVLELPGYGCSANHFFSLQFPSPKASQ